MLKQKKLHLGSIFNNKGMSIVEVLVAAGLASIVALGIATMVQNMMIEQKKVTLLATLRELKLRMETNIRDQRTWDATLTGNAAIAPFTALVANTNVTSAPTTPVAFNLYAGPATPLFALSATPTVPLPLLAWDSSGTGGFTEGGQTCNTFNNAAGNDACPISYRLVIAADCGGPATCANPQLTIVARLIFRPSAGGTLNRFANLLSYGDMGSVSGVAGKYDVFIRRTGTKVNRSFKLASRVIGTAAATNWYSLFTSNCASNGAGTCSTTEAVHPRLTTSGWYAPDGASSLVTTTGANFRFTEAGTYQCQVAVTAFATDTFNAYLYKNGAAFASGSAIAGKWSTGTATFEKRFILSNAELAHDFTIFQRCSTIPDATGNFVSADTSIGNCSLGMDTATYGGAGTDVIVVNCTKIEDSTN